MSAFIFISTTHTAHIQPEVPSYTAQMETLTNASQAQLQNKSGKMRPVPKRRRRPSLLPGARPDSVEQSSFALSYDTLKDAKEAARIKKIKKL